MPPYRLEEREREEKGVTDNEAKRRLTRWAGSWVLLAAGCVVLAGWVGLGWAEQGRAGWLAGWLQTLGADGWARLALFA